MNQQNGREAFNGFGKTGNCFPLLSQFIAKIRPLLPEGLGRSQHGIPPPQMIPLPTEEVAAAWGDRLG